MTDLPLGVRELNDDELAAVSGGFLGRVVGAVTEAVCNAVSRGRRVASCAVAGVAAEEAVRVYSEHPADNSGAYACAKIGDCSGLKRS